MLFGALPGDGSLRRPLPSGYDSCFGASLHLDSLSSVVAGRYPYGLPFPLDVDLMRRAQHVDGFNQVPSSSRLSR
jgi:hypothetical protein